MALNWEWKNKCGELTLKQMNEAKESKEYTISLYQGNATLIMLHEYTDDRGQDVYDLFGFFCDKQHMKNCLGLAKGERNLYDTPYQTITKLRLDKAKNRYWKDIIAAFTQAFDTLTVEVYDSSKQPA